MQLHYKFLLLVTQAPCGGTVTTLRAQNELCVTMLNHFTTSSMSAAATTQLYFDALGSTLSPSRLAAAVRPGQQGSQ
jgi:hypothetical protein